MIQKILIGDDEPEILNTFSELLTHYGFEVVTASNAEEFQNNFIQSNPDLIILDIFFGPDSGPDVYDRVMKLSKASAPPVIFMTGKLEGIKESPLMRGRQVAMYAKPLNVEKLVADIRAAFSNSIAA